MSTEGGQRNGVYVTNGIGRKGVIIYLCAFGIGIGTYATWQITSDPGFIIDKTDRRLFAMGIEKVYG